MIPALGGLMWDVLDPAVPFLLGALIALVSLTLTRRMRVPQAETPLAQASEGCLSF